MSKCVFQSNCSYLTVRSAKQKLFSNPADIVVFTHELSQEFVKFETVNIAVLKLN